jgi:hypothetical protein
MGGVIYFDMLYIPPQPKKVAQWVICELEHPQVDGKVAQWVINARYILFTRNCINDTGVK